MAAAEWPKWLQVTRQWTAGDQLMCEARIVLPVLHTFKDGAHCSSCDRWVPNGEQHDCPYLGGFICGWCGAVVRPYLESHYCPERPAPPEPYSYSRA